ncbi:hypothetical protein IL252_11195 [Halomicrobium sp. IBSBa]|uniref:hypothetical protein n=1 Tax=Halomicrobium sp. IBSBa TaxID=2778916 RepID=UPI001ABFA80A|nr:hypothetical protein [Halomicrobium sp. IBSBa]MBO4248379.1 hypothetical protein [Halomicrobium sp. IBSBa]
MASPIAGSAAAAQPGLNFTSEKTPNPTIVEDELVVTSHDMDEMDGPLEYYDDSGEVATLPATVNQSQDTPVGIRFDKIDADVYTQFPRISGEVDNEANWTVATDWTTSSGGSSSMSVADADADGVEKLEFAASAASGETATATLSENVSITNDPNKRVLSTVLNVETLSGTAELRAVDGDGDYRYAEINGSENADASDIIANSTGNGYVLQERLSNLPLAGSGDGSFDAIQKVEIVAIDNDVTVTVAGLDLDKKSEYDLAEIERDTDSDGEREQTVVTDYYEGGTADITGLDTLGSEFDSAVLKDLHVYDVRYEFADLTDESEYSINVTSADEYSYPQKLELYADLQVPSPIDLSHGTLTLEFEQGLPGERYQVAEVAPDADSDAEFGNVSDSEYTSYGSSLNSQGTTHELATVSADTNQRVHFVILYQNEEVDTLQDTSAMGPTGTSGDGFFSSLFGKAISVVGAVLGAVGLRRYAGGS